MEIPTLLIYISSYEKYLIDMVNTEPFRFLRKPIVSELFNSAFMAACKKVTKETQYFFYTYNKTNQRIPLPSICYFESNNRVIYIHTIKKLKVEDLELSEDTAKLYGKMNDVEKSLADSNQHFIRIHQSYLVNFDCIRSMTFNNVILSDGTVLQISEDRQKNVRKLFCSLASVEV